MTTRFERMLEHARVFATAAHGAVGQKRKYTGAPYIEHPAAVARMVWTVTQDPEVAAAAWLHDSVEDTQVTLDDIETIFGPKVREYVFYVTDISKPEDGNRAKRKAMDREHYARGPAGSQTIKVADLIDNSKTIVAYDKDFARVYIPEKRLVLSALCHANASLHAMAQEQIAEAERELAL